MWSTAYGLIALAVVAFVVLYAALHAPAFTSVNLADQLYYAKSRLESSLPSLPRTDKPAYFRVYSNIVRIEVANATYGNHSFPVELPLGYRLAAEGKTTSSTRSTSTSSPAGRSRFKAAAPRCSTPSS